MAEILFPTNPGLLEEYTHPTTQTVYMWNGVQWRIKPSVNGEVIDKAMYRLPATANFLTVANDGLDPIYDSSMFLYDCSVYQVFSIQYSVVSITGDALREGRVSLKVLDTGVGLTVILDDEYTENRRNDVSYPPIGPDFTFSYERDGVDLLLNYKHDFPQDVILVTYTKKWASSLA